MEYEVVLQYIRPELLVLVVVLYVIGMFIKNTKYIPDEMIPLFLGIISIFLTAIYVVSVSQKPTSYQEVFGMMFDIIIQGICCAAGAVYFNQLGKQHMKLKELDKDGEQE